MLISHTIESDVLRVKLLRDLDVTARAAAALEIEALVSAHRPGRVLVELATPTPSPASLSALARARRMCQSFGIPLSATGAGTPSWTPHESRGMEVGARRGR